MLQKILELLQKMLSPSMSGPQAGNKASASPAKGSKMLHTKFGEEEASPDQEADVEEADEGLGEEFGGEESELTEDQSFDQGLGFEGLEPGADSEQIPDAHNLVEQAEGLLEKYQQSVNGPESDESMKKTKTDEPEVEPDGPKGPGM